jgi:hypothetical protein
MKSNLSCRGVQLRADLDEALRRAGEELGRTLESDEAERHTIDQAPADTGRGVSQKNSVVTVIWTSPTRNFDTRICRLF